MATHGALDMLLREIAAVKKIRDFRVKSLPLIIFFVATLKKTVLLFHQALLKFGVKSISKKRLIKTKGDGSAFVDLSNKDFL